MGDVAKIVGDIATDELKNMGDEALTTGDKIAKLKADWDNWTVSVGQALIVIAEYYGILEDRRPAQIIAAQRADEHAQALARVRSALKDLATEEEKKAKLDELSAKNSENNAKALQALSDIEERRASLVAQITEAEQKAEAFRNGARQLKVRHNARNN